MSHLKNMTELKIISSKEETPDIDFGIKNIIRKRVLGNNGEVVGKITDVIAKNNKILGITVKKGRIKYFVDYEYIKEFCSKSIFLKVDPVVRYINMLVYDENGKKLGKVIDILQKHYENDIKSISVKKSIFEKSIKINADKIEISKKNIILKK